MLLAITLIWVAAAVGTLSWCWSRCTNFEQISMACATSISVAFLETDYTSIFLVSELLIWFLMAGRRTLQYFVTDDPIMQDESKKFILIVTARAAIAFSTFTTFIVM